MWVLIWITNWSDEGLVAQSALVWSLASVDSHVSVQLEGVLKRLLTEGAGVGALHVDPQVD